MKRISSKFLSLWLVIFALAGCAEIELASHVAKQTPIPSSSKSQGTFKVGTPYKIKGQWYKPQETYSFEQTGIASWYGPNFHGKKTANGETFDMYELTAAHKTLQMPSLVRVTNLENGRSLVVRINDRGPFSKGRIIDLSKRSAELLGFKNQGTARVKVQLLSEESRRVAQAARNGRDTSGTEVALNQRVAKPQARPQTQTRVATAQNAKLEPVQRADIQTDVPGRVEQGRFYPDPVVKQMPITDNKLYVQAASFGTHDQAHRYVQQLSSVVNAHVQPAVVRGQNFYRVRIGPLEGVPQADGVLANLASIGNNDAILVVD